MPKVRETCTECSIRRQRCNRRIPCDRCIRRGIADSCTREWPTEHAPRSSIVPRSMNREEHGEDDAKSEAAPALHTPHSSEAMQLVIDDDEPPTGSGARNEQPFVDDPAMPPLDPALAVLQLQLPTLDKIWSLVDFHERYLLWYHGCYHGPTFREELNHAVAGVDQLNLSDLNLQWASLLFSIMAGSLCCSSEAMYTSWGFWREEIAELSMQWYQAAVSCLNLGKYTSLHQLHSVHAITTLSMSAHALGLSEDLSVLLSAALRIARSLGIARIKCNDEPKEFGPFPNDPHRKKVLEKEIARRLWSQLCIQDWLAIPFYGSQCINLTDYTTTKPSNRNHITMEALPETTPTYISYGNYLYEIAKLIAEHHASMIRSSTPYTKYNRVLEFDARMKRLARQEMPVYFQVTMPIDPNWPEWVPWARRSLTICFAHKVLMIHRDFIQQSFTNPAFHVTKATCLAASITILKEAKKEMEEDGPIIGIDQAFCIAAGLILCVAIFYSNSDDPENRMHTDLIRDCIDMLARFETSVVASRGITLLETLLSEREKLGRLSIITRKRRYSDGWTPIYDVGPGWYNDLMEAVLPEVPNAGLIQVGRDHNEFPPRWFLDYEKFSFKCFADLLPPQAGISNEFLSNHLLRFLALEID